jgi:hypothetical protein
MPARLLAVFALLAALLPIPAAARGGILGMTDGIDLFIHRQMEKFDAVRPAGQPPLVQTYDLDPAAWPLVPVPPYPVQADMPWRGDVYDQSVALGYLSARGDLAGAQKLADALRFLSDHDPTPDGRLHAAYYANNLMSPDGTSTSIFAPDIGTGNMAWAGIGLARFYDAATKAGFLTPADRLGYLDAAKAKADWILSNCKQTDGPGGFSGGLLGWTYTAAPWRSTEHNIDVYVLASDLYELDRDAGGQRQAKWKDMADHAAAFVRQMFDATQGYYFTGTGADGVTPNPSPLPADAQAWAALARIDDPANLRRAMQWLADNLLVTDALAGYTPGDPRVFRGLEFSSTGSHIQCEETAGAAMVPPLWTLLGLASGEAWEASLAALLADLDLIRATADGADPQGIGVVATPWPAGAPTGYGDTYPDLRHVAGSAWTGLAVLVAGGDAMGNPLEPLPEPATAGLLAAGALALGFRRRRRH